MALQDPAPAETNHKEVDHLRLIAFAQAPHRPIRGRNAIEILKTSGHRSCHNIHLALTETLQRSETALTACAHRCLWLEGHQKIDCTRFVVLCFIDRFRQFFFDD
jgi:hypothetical protein